MKFADLPAGASVFVDANPLVDHFSANPTTGAACQALLARIANQELIGITSVHILGEMSHRLMTIEACALFGWPYKGIAQRLAGHPAEILKLHAFRQALDDVVAFGLRVLPIAPAHVFSAADLARQHGLLYNDALVVAVMQEQGFQNLASSDADFDRVPGISRYAPI